MNRPANDLIRDRSFLAERGALWAEAFKAYETATRLADRPVSDRFGGDVPIARSDGRTASPAAAVRLAALKAQIDQEIVAFHNRLPIAPAAPPESLAPSVTGKVFRIDVPITLFPKRDQGFSRVEVMVELTCKGGQVRILALEPALRKRTFGKVDLGAQVSIEGYGRTPVAVSVAKASAQVYGQAEMQTPTFGLERDCVVAEIVGGRAAIWRLDDPHDVRRVRTEAHQLAMIVEVTGEQPIVSAQGYITAESRTAWLTATLGNVWEHFRGRLHEFFRRGLPTEAEASWDDLLGEFYGSEALVDITGDQSSR